MSIIAIYVVFKHNGMLMHNLKTSKILRGFVIFLITISIVEAFHPNASYSNIIRSFMICASAVMIASVFMSDAGIEYIARTYVVSGALVAIYMFFSGYFVLLSSNATSFNEAELIRFKLISELKIDQDFNNLAFNQGLSFLLASVFFLKGSSNKIRSWYLIIMVLTFVGLTVTMSRGGFVTVLLSFLTVLIYFRIDAKRKWGIVMLFLVIILLLIPSAVLSRMDFGLGRNSEMNDGRSKVFAASMDAIVNEGALGVGEGNFWSDWGKNSGFARYSGAGVSVRGTHNLFFQIIINWGLIGIITFVILLFQIFHFRPPRNEPNTTSLIFITVFVASLLYMAQIHNLQTKDFIILISVGIIHEYLFYYKRSVDEIETI